MIQKHLVDQLALALLEGQFQPGDRVLVDAADGELTFSRPAQPGAEYDRCAVGVDRSVRTFQVS